MQALNITKLILFSTLNLSLATVGCKKTETTPTPSEASIPAEAPAEASADAPDDHAGHDHAAGDDHAGHDHGDHAGHDHGDHAGHDHAANDDHAGDDIMDLVLKEGTFDADAVVRQPGAKIGDITRCTVSGEAFPVTDAHPHVTYEGEEIYFCCPGCIRRFQRNPAQYIADQK